MPAAQAASMRKGRSTLRRYDLPLLEFHGREHGILFSIAYPGQTVKILCLRCVEYATYSTAGIYPRDTFMIPP